MAKDTKTSKVKPPEQLSQALGVDLKDISLWTQALTHKSKKNVPHYERLEYLGDAILKSVVSAWQFEAEPPQTESQMTQARAVMVSDKTLAELAEQYHLFDYIQVGPTELYASTARGRLGIVASSFEAVIGVIYLESGYDGCTQFLNRVLKPYASEMVVAQENINAKQLLQEWTQQHDKSLPEYRLVETSGPVHNQQFKIEVWYQDRCLSTALGISKKEAEKEAARLALLNLKPER
jgi:ribonuclease III